ncbi:cobalamin B12-binding domain-containing protein [Gemmatimonas sp.]|uniref:cobalamin B12-binding domain-containing protein n=1 Tax=Gemmatimonas sp. TaxID=1962908 RepID=UPI00286AF809|nr:cobalamin B12-binding domain-containing protein [Gemmatimonas sp.]
MPRLLASHRAGPVPPALSMAMARELSERDVDGFVAAVRSVDDSRAVQFLRDILAEGATVEAVYLDLLAPSARRLGQMWDNDECDFVEVTVSLGRMQRMLRDLSQVFLADATRSEPVGSVLLTCIPGEQHTLGIIMVGEFLLRDGWRVLVGAPWSESDLLTMVGTEWFDVIGFSVGSESRLPLLKRDIRRLKSASRNPHLQFMVGGQVFSDDPTLVDQVGANAIAGDAREAPQIARRLLDAAQRAASDAPLREALGDHGQFSDALRRE